MLETDEEHQPPPPPPPPTGRLAFTFRALRHRNYRLFFLGQCVSLVGTWVQITAMMWLASHLTESSRWPALVVASQILPTFFLAIWGGQLAEHWSKRGLIILTQIAFLVLALLLAGLAWLGVLQPWHLLAIGLLNGVVNAIDLPVRLTFLVDMVGREDVINAVALNSLQFNVARAIGPAIGGLALAWINPEACFLLNAISFAAVLAALVQMTPTPPHPRHPEHEKRGVFEAFRYVGRRPTLALVITMAFAMSLFGWPFQSLLPRLATQFLHSEEEGYSLMVSATGCGALVAALLIAGYGSMSRRRTFMEVGVLLTCVSLLGLSASGHLLHALVWCALLGGGLIAFFANGQAVVQLGADDHNRGRVMGIWSMALSGGLPLGNLLAGLAADRWTEPVVLRVQGIACGVLAVILIAGLAWARE
jgi:MFS family permease